MPSIPFKNGSSNSKVILDVRPDRIDLRDLVYRPQLVNLPPRWPQLNVLRSWIPDYAKLILNQENEGACTGFGLAAAINYLLFCESHINKRKFPFKQVSATMLYRLARLYDEWPGDDYEGSSCRGALKGWHKHGVCSSTSWPNKPSTNDGPRRKNWKEEAIAVRMGAYFRIDRSNLNDMQSAIYEVGVIYVSAEVHAGWNKDQLIAQRNEGKLPLIAYDSGVKPDGAHAFAIIGYSQQGFIVQNSWGDDWGNNGFGILSYDDWLRFGMDAWVAVLGVSSTINNDSNTSNRWLSANHSQRSSSLPASSTSSTSIANLTIWSRSEALQRTVIFGNNGVAIRRAVEHSDGAAAVRSVACEEVKNWVAQQPKNKPVKVAIYAHGGLSNEDDSLRRISILGPWFERNRIFPIFLTWKTGFMETTTSMLSDSISEWFGDSRAAGGWLLDKLADAKDRSLEYLCSELLVRAMWTEMKENAAAASQAECGMDITLRSLAEAATFAAGQNKNLELHLIGHSAGSLILGHAMKLLEKYKLATDTKSFHLFAPACTLDFANRFFVPAMAENGALHPARCDFVCHLLDDTAELADSVGPYGKSLLYLISRALESIHKTPILGMEAAWRKPAKNDTYFHESFLGAGKSLDQWSKNSQKVRSIIYRWGEHVFDDGQRESSPSHGGFDNDVHVINATIASILGTKPIEKVTNLAGF